MNPAIWSFGVRKSMDGLFSHLCCCGLIFTSLISCVTKCALSVVTQGKDKAIGRCLGAQGINAVITRVQNVVVEKGFVTTHILVAPQDLKSGELVLVVIPGRLRNIIFESDEPQRLLKKCHAD